MKKLTLPALAMAGLLTLGLAGCTQPAVEEKAEPAAAKETPATEETVEAKAEPAAAGDIVEPGAVIENGDWFTYEFENYDGAKAVMQARLAGITPATQAQVDTLVAEIPDLKGYNVVLITFDEQKVSGDDITYSSGYTDFRPATVKGEKGQEVIVAGWDDCGGESYSEEFNAGGVPVTSCVVGAWVEGGDEIGGLIWTGPSAVDDSPYSNYEGQPVFLKG